MSSQEIDYQVRGKRYVGHLALPEGTDRRAGVLVCHEGFGIDEHAVGYADRLAADLGVVAFALDYYGDGKSIPTEEMMSHLGPLSQDDGLIRELGRAGLGILTGQDRVDTARVAAIGFCFGGTMSLEIARDGAELAAVVGFHAGLNTERPAQAGGIRPAVLVCSGSEDPFVPVEQRVEFQNEMQAAGADWRLSLYGGAKHGFTNPTADSRGMDAIGYNAVAARRSWAEMTTFLKDALAL